MTITRTLKYFAPAFLVLFGLAVAATVWANPFYVGTKAKSAAATTTVTYMTPGTATSTVVYDSYEQGGTNQTNSGNATIPHTLAVLLQGNASSTATKLTSTCEFSDDGVDWYQNEIAPGTTTNAVSIAPIVTNDFTYASSTVGGAGLAANTTRFAKAFLCPIPTRYVRAVTTLTGANASLWVALVPKKERN